MFDTHGIHHNCGTISWLISHQSAIFTGIILCVRPANERRRYILTLSLIDWAHIANSSLYL